MRSRSRGASAQGPGPAGTRQRTGRAFCRGGCCYERAAAAPARRSYPLINAAAMAAQAGDRAKAGLLAGRVLHLIESGAERGETPYSGRRRTRAGAVIARRVDDARACLASAVALTPQAWEDHAVTLLGSTCHFFGQLQIYDWLDPYRPPPVMHFNGILGLPPMMAQRIAIGAAVAAIAPGFAYGALAAGATSSLPKPCCAKARNCMWFRLRNARIFAHRRLPRSARIGSIALTGCYPTPNWSPSAIWMRALYRWRCPGRIARHWGWRSKRPTSCRPEPSHCGSSPPIVLRWAIPAAFRPPDPPCRDGTA